MLIRKNDGYALPFVLIVMVIICLVGISIMSASLNNLQNQKASIERMQDRYEVAGQIEKLMAEIDKNGCVSESVIENYADCGMSLVPVEDGKLFKYTKSIDSDYYKIGTLVFGVKVLSDSEETGIVCKIQITGSISESNENGTLKYYKISNIKNGARMDPIYDYLSYEIINITGEGGNES